jgi:hypothetical protein
MATLDELTAAVRGADPPESSMVSLSVLLPVFRGALI